MEEQMDLQEMFDLQCEFDAPRIHLLNSFNQLWSKYSVPAMSGTLPKEYHKELKELADSLSLKYTEPMYRNGLTEVRTSPTVH